MKLINAKLYGQDGKWDIEIREDTIVGITPTSNMDST